MQVGPASDEFTFRYDFVPSADDGGKVKLVHSALVTAMLAGELVMVDEVNCAPERALLSINPVCDGRLSLYLPSTGQTIVAQPGFGLILAYNPGVLDGTDLPDAWLSRFPALEVRSNWPALVKLGPPEPLVAAATRLDQLRLAGDDGLVWSPQFRDVESIVEMTRRVGERVAIGFFVSDLHEQVTAGKIQEEGASPSRRPCRQMAAAHRRTWLSERRRTKDQRPPRAISRWSNTQAERKRHETRASPSRSKVTPTSCAPDESEKRRTAGRCPTCT